MAAATADLEVLGDFMEPGLELLSFYRQKIAGFEAERAQYLSRLADVEVRWLALPRHFLWPISAIMPQCLCAHAGSECRASPHAMGAPSSGR